MFRFTIRDLLWLMVVVGLGIALVASYSWKRFQYQKASQIITYEYRESLNSQYEVAKIEFHRRTEAFGRGRMALSDYCDTVERFVKASSDAIESPEMRIEQYTSALHAVRELEDVTRSKIENDVEPSYYLDRVQYTRFLIEGKITLAQQEVN